MKEVAAAHRGGDGKSEVVRAAAEGVGVGSRRGEELVEGVKGIGSGRAKEREVSLGS